MNILITLGVIQGLIFAVFLFHKRKRNKGNLFLFFTAILAVLQIALVLWINNSAARPTMLRITMYTWVNPLAIPILFFLYTKTITTERPEIEKNDHWHGLPVGLAALFVCILLVSTYIKDPDSANLEHYSVEEEILAFYKAAVLIIYSLMSIRLLFGFRKRIRQEFSNLHNKQLNWLWFLIGSSFIIGLLELGNAITGSRGPDINPNQMPLADYISPYTVFAIVAIMFYYGAYKAIMQPEVFDHRFRLAERQARNIAMEIGLKEKYQHSKLDAQEAKLLSEKLARFMKDGRPYLDQDLTLTGLAGKMDCSKHVLSQLINEHMGKNFFEFVNGYRIEDAKQKLVNKDYSYLTIAGIANEAGFRSKSTFYKIFKDLVGMSPASYQKEFG